MDGRAEDYADEAMGIHHDDDHSVQPIQCADPQHNTAVHRKVNLKGKREMSNKKKTEESKLVDAVMRDDNDTAMDSLKKIVQQKCAKRIKEVLKNT